MNRSQARSHTAAAAGYFLPTGESANSSSASCAASASASHAVWTGLSAAAIALRSV